MQNTKRTSMAMAGTLLLLMIASAVPAQAANTSDEGGNDSCTAYDTDGIYDNPPNGDPNSCDGDSTTTTVTSSFNGGVLTGCVNAWTPSGDASQCSGGFIFNADDATAAGNFGGDWPIATSVAITATDITPMGTAATGVNLEIDYISGLTGTPGTVAAPLCMANGVTYTIDAVGGTDAYDLPAAAVGDFWTITQVSGFRASVGAACGLPANAGLRSISGAWSYTTDAAATAAATVGAMVDNGDGTCNFTWSVAATSGGRYGTATGQLDIDGGLVFGYFVQDALATSGTGATISDDETTTGISVLFYGEWATAAATGWGVGAAFDQAQSTSALGLGSYEVTAANQCMPGSIPPDPGQLLEPVCVVVGVYNAGWTVPPTGVCVNFADLPNAVFSCVAVGTDGASCAPTDASCTPVQAAALAVAVPGGASQSTLGCSGTGAIAVADTAVAGFPVSLIGGLKTSGAWTCDVNFTPSADGVYVGACIDTVIPV